MSPDSSLQCLRDGSRLDRCTVIGCRGRSSSSTLTGRVRLRQTPRVLHPFNFLRQILQLRTNSPDCRNFRPQRRQLLHYCRYIEMFDMFDVYLEVNEISQEQQTLAVTC